MRRGQPSPSGRGQGEGSDVTLPQLLLGPERGMQIAIDPLLPSVNQTGRSNVRVDPMKPAPTPSRGIRQSQFRLTLAPIWCGRGVLAPAPITAKEELRSTPHPALSRRERVLLSAYAFPLPTRDVQLQGDAEGVGSRVRVRVDRRCSQNGTPEALHPRMGPEECQIQAHDRYRGSYQPLSFERSQC